MSFLEEFFLRFLRDLLLCKLLVNKVLELMLPEEKNIQISLIRTLNEVSKIKYIICFFIVTPIFKTLGVFEICFPNIKDQLDS